MYLALIYAFEQFHYLDRKKSYSLNLISNPILVSYFLIFSIVFWVFLLSISVLYLLHVFHTLQYFHLISPCSFNFLLFFFFFVGFCPSSHWIVIQIPERFYNVNNFVFVEKYPLFLFVFSFVFRFSFFILLFCCFSPLHLVNIILLCFFLYSAINNMVLVEGTDVANCSVFFRKIVVIVDVAVEVIVVVVVAKLVSRNLFKDPFCWYLFNEINISCYNTATNKHNKNTYNNSRFVFNFCCLSQHKQCHRPSATKTTMFYNSSENPISFTFILLHSCKICFFLILFCNLLSLSAIFSPSLSPSLSYNVVKIYEITSYTILTWICCLYFSSSKWVLCIALNHVIEFSLFLKSSIQMNWLLGFVTFFTIKKQVFSVDSRTAIRNKGNFN